jgi:FkbM family methyltransferase
MLKSTIRNIFSILGYSIKKNKINKQFRTEDNDSMLAGLYRIKNLGIQPSTIIDIGAAQGTWTQKALNVWPSAKFELIEPLIEQQQILKNLKIEHSNIDYYMAAAGENKGEITMNVSIDLDGSGIYGEDSANARKVSILRIDDLCNERPGDFFLKLDTHGYEIPILKGALKTLKNTSVLVIEVYGFFVSPTGLLFNQLSTYLDDLGFRLIDIVDIMRRPGDQAFWQADAFFIRKDHPVFTNNSYA